MFSPQAIRSQDECRWVFDRSQRLSALHYMDPGGGGGSKTLPPLKNVGGSRVNPKQQTQIKKLNILQYWIAHAMAMWSPPPLPVPDLKLETPCPLHSLVLYCMFILTTISPCTTRLKALYSTHPDCTQVQANCLYWLTSPPPQLKEQRLKDDHLSMSLRFFSLPLGDRTQWQRDRHFKWVTSEPLCICLYLGLSPRPLCS